MGSGDDYEAPAPQASKFEIYDSTPEFRPTNFLEMFDAVSGDKFKFVKDTEGNISIYNSNTKGRVPIQLPQIGNVDNVDVGEITSIALLSESLNRLSNTIETLGQTDPMMIRENQATINAFKQANETALQRGFDIKVNNINNKLKKMGMEDSTSGLAYIIQQENEKASAKIMNNLKEYELANNLKQNTLQNYYNLGKQNLSQMQGELTYHSMLKQTALENNRNIVAMEQLKNNRAVAEQELKLKERNLNNFNALGLNTAMQSNNLALSAQNNLNVSRAANEQIQLGLDEYGLKASLAEEQMRPNYGGAIGTLAGAGVGAITGGLSGAQLGASIGKIGGSIISGKV